MVVLTRILRHSPNSLFLTLTAVSGNFFLAGCIIKHLSLNSKQCSLMPLVNTGSISCWPVTIMNIPYNPSPCTFMLNLAAQKHSWPGLIKVQPPALTPGPKPQPPGRVAWPFDAPPPVPGKQDKLLCHGKYPSHFSSLFF